MSPRPSVTVLIPARNEVADLRGCLAAVLDQDHPAADLQIVVVDGGSTDGTGELARAVLGAVPGLTHEIVVNEQGTTPSNLNAGLAVAVGSILCRVDARTRIEPHYVSTCRALLEERDDVAVVGGAQVAVARDRSARSQGIARALNNRWAMGGSPYRAAAESQAADTVYLGAFRVADLIAVGGWNEEMLSNQDFELNRRMATRGFVWFDARLQSSYLPRQTHREVWTQYRRFGEGKVRYWRATGDRPQPRQAAILAAPLAAAAIAVLAPRRAVATAAVVGIVGLEEGGAPPGPSALGARFHAMIALLMVTVGWTTGIWKGLVSAP
ncbi:MAG: glycosyltransferase [Acidimicrobiales bacterium]